MTDTGMDDAVVLLTGGTSGIGRIAARELASRGATVAIVGRDESRGQRVAGEGAERCGEIDFYRADLSRQADVRALAADVLEAYDRLDVLVHNAGLSARDGPLR